jgi:hypothetical protein
VVTDIGNRFRESKIGKVSGLEGCACVSFRIWSGTERSLIWKDKKGSKSKIRRRFIYVWCIQKKGKTK